MAQLVSLAIVKENLGLEKTSQYDDYLTRQIQAASEAVENYCKRRFEQVAGEVEEYFLGEDFDDYRVGRVFVSRVPVQAVGSVVAEDWDGLTRTLTALAYQVKPNLGYVFFPMWSREQDWRLNLVKLTVTYDGGYDPIPDVVQQVTSDIVRTRFYRRDEDPGRLIRSESVPDVGSVAYDTGGAAGGSEVSLTPGQKHTLGAYRINQTS